MFSKHYDLVKHDDNINEHDNLQYYSIKYNLSQSDGIVTFSVVF